MTAFTLGTIGYLVYAIHMGGRLFMLFEMNEEGITLTNVIVNAGIIAHVVKKLVVVFLYRGTGEERLPGNQLLA